MVRVRLVSPSYSRTSDSTCSRTSFCSTGAGESAVLLPLPMRYERPKSTKGSSTPLVMSRDRRSGMKDLDVICIERGVGGDQLERFQLRHRDEQPIERIAMMIRQLCHAAGVMVLDG